jgi:cytochrome P450
VSETQARPYPFSDPRQLIVDPTYADLRAHDPVTRVQMPYGEPAWLVTRYEDVRMVLADPRFSRAAAMERDEPRLRSDGTMPGIMAMDPPDHSRLRRLVSKAFTPKRVEELRPRTADVADALVDAMLAAGSPVDVVEEFAAPLPVTVICELLGVPEQDRQQFRVWTEAVMSTTSLTETQVRDYFMNMYTFIGGLVAQRRVEPTDDLLGAMVRARDEDNDRLTEEEMVVLAAQLLAAGHETTVTQIPNFLYVLLTQPHLWADLCADPGLVPGAVEELMRFVPISVGALFARYATADVEISGVTVKAGEPVVASMTSANRDETVFADPDTVDLRRGPTAHVGFGHGAHHCLGAQLARMELQVALETLIRRVPTLRLAVPAEELSWKTGSMVRGFVALPVAW